MNQAFLASHSCTLGYVNRQSGIASLYAGLLPASDLRFNSRLLALFSQLPNVQVSDTTEVQ